MEDNQNRWSAPPVMKPLKKNRELIDCISAFFFLTGIFLMTFEIDIFHKTIIDWEIPAGIWLGAGLISAIIFQKNMREYLLIDSIFWQLIICAGSFGGFFTYGFMAANYYLEVGKTTEIVKVRIIETGYLADGGSGCEEPYAYVNIKGAEKQLIFPCEFELENYKFIKLKLRPGIFGFDKVLGQSFSKE